jgi:hypothetical protein
LAPDVLQIAADRGDALVLEVIEVLRAVSFVGDETGLGEQLEVARDGGPTDWELVGELLDGVWTAREQLDDGSALGVAEGVERIGERGRAPRHAFDRNSAVTVTQWLRRTAALRLSGAPK